nr:MAG TPA: hypothetical protein [Caudoviricetes sp.]
MINNEKRRVKNCLIRILFVFWKMLKTKRGVYLIPILLITCVMYQMQLLQN